MGLKNCQIQLDNPWNTYYAGQTINGQVTLTFDSPKKVRDISISIYGINVYDVHGIIHTDPLLKLSLKCNLDLRMEYLSKLKPVIKYINYKSYLVRSVDFLNPIKIDTGEYEYCFQQKLPLDSPPTFEDVWGYIRYVIEITVKPHLFIPKQKFYKTFYIASRIKMRRELKLRQTFYLAPKIGLSTTKDIFDKTFSITVNVIKTGFAPTHIIPINISCDNQTSVSVKIIKIYLRQTNNYPLQICPDVTYLKEQIVDSIYAETTNEWNVQLEIPLMQPLNLLHCEHINHDIMIRVKFMGPHKDLIGTMPIIIGTVPFKEKFITRNNFEPLIF